MGWKDPSLGQEDPLEKGMAYLLQYACLENSMDRGAWRATVHGNSKTLFKSLKNIVWLILLPSFYG